MVRPWGTRLRLAENSLKVALVFDADATAQHDAPAWRERADFIIGVALPEEGKWEQLWALRLAPAQFEVCCVPFLAYDLALGDIVETEPQSGRDFMVARVVRQSGHRTMRVWFLDTAVAEEVADRLTGGGAVLEWRGAGSRLLAVDAPDDEATHRFAYALRPFEAAGSLNYETGWS